MIISSNPIIDYDSICRPILRSYRENNNLIRLHLKFVSIRGGEELVSKTVGSCANLREVRLQNCSLTGEQLLPIVESLKDKHSLDVLDLHGNLGHGYGLSRNSIGDVGCRALATLLGDPSCNLQYLDIRNNNISFSGANALVNSLANNTKLKQLILVDRSTIRTPDERVTNDLTRLLCNTSSISATFCSNHTLAGLSPCFNNDSYWDGTFNRELFDLLTLNRGANKSRVAIKKILQYHPVIDMSPLFQLDSEGEWSLKLLPYAIAWFERARKAVSNDIFLPPRTKRELRTRKLSAIYQFAQAMPMLFVPITHTKIGDKKRKREDTVDA